jgi:hypothetical protein
MFRRIAMVVAVVALSVGACSGEEPLRGIDLPPASVPDSIVEGAWAIRFTHDFPPGAWAQGDHAYALALACDAILDEPMRTDPITFSVTPGQVFDQEIYLRVVGLSDNTAGPPTLSTIDPQQPTTAALTIIGVSESAANEAADTCAGAIFFDDADPLPLVPETPFRP